MKEIFVWIIISRMVLRLMWVRQNALRSKQNFNFRATSSEMTEWTEWNFFLVSFNTFLGNLRKAICETAKNLIGFAGLEASRESFTTRPLNKSHGHKIRLGGVHKLRDDPLLKTKKRKSFQNQIWSLTSLHNTPAEKKSNYFSSMRFPEPFHSSFANKKHTKKAQS